MPKIIVAASVAYALSPVDLIPDFIQVLGLLDELIILPLLISLSLKLIPAGIMAECREQAKDMWKDGKPKKWYYALPVIAVWLLVIPVALRVIWGE